MEHNQVQELQEQQFDPTNNTVAQQPQQPVPPVEQETGDLGVDNALTEASMQPSYSMMTNVPSQPTEGMEGGGLEGAVWPSLGKMESDHLAEVGPMVVDFAKRNSEGEGPVQPSEHSHPQEIIEGATDLESNISNAATLNSQQLQDFNFGDSPSKEVERNEDEPVCLNEKSEENHNKHQVVVEEKEEEKGQTLAEKQEEKEVEQQKKVEETEEVKQVVQASPVENLEEKKQEITVEASQPVSNQVPNEVDPGAFVQQEEKEAVFFQAEKPAVEPQIQKEEVVVHEEKEVSEMTTEKQEEPKSSEEIPKEQEKQVIQVEQPAQTQVSDAKQEEVQKPQQRVQLAEEEDDQFGDFEQTIPTPKIEQPVEQSKEQPIPQQPEPQKVQTKASNPTLNQIIVDPSKLDMGVDANERQKELQQFVDSLPDYTFILKQAFASM